MIEPAVEALCHVVLEVPFKIVALFLPCSTDFVGLNFQDSTSRKGLPLILAYPVDAGIANCETGNEFTFKLGGNN